MGRGSRDTGQGDRTGAHHLSFQFGFIYANANRFTDEVRGLVERAPTKVHCLIVDAGAITDIDYSAAQSIRDLFDDLAAKGVGVVFARVSPYLRSDMDRHNVTAAIGDARIFTTLHEAIAAVRGGAPGISAER